VADQNRRSRDFQQNQQLAAWQTDSQPQQRNGYTAAWQDKFQPQQRNGYTDYNQPLGHAWARGGFGDLQQNQPLVHARFNGRWTDQGHWPRAEDEHERAAERWHEEPLLRLRIQRLQNFIGGQADEVHWQGAEAEAENERAAQRRHEDARAAEERAHAAEARRVADAQRAHEDARAAGECARAAAEVRRFADNRCAHEDARAQDAPAAAERACAARDARHARHARKAAVAAGAESTGKPEQRAVNEPGPELEQPYGPIGHRPERRIAIGIAAAAKPGGEQDKPKQRAAVTATGEPGAELEQRVAIAIADESERRARELIEPEQHVPGGDRPSRSSASPSPPPTSRSSTRAS